MKMPQHVANSPKMNYGNNTVTVKNVVLYEYQKMGESSTLSQKVEITNLGVKSSFKC